MITKKRWIVAAISSSLALSFIDMTAIAVSLPQIQRMLNASTTALHWVVNAYLLSIAVFIMLGGYLGDRYGHRKLFLIGTVIFAISSITCAFAHNILDLNISRFLQGVGAALFTPNSAVMIFQLFPDEERGKQMGIMVGSASFFLATGPVLGGILTEFFTWRAIFLINLPLSIFSILVIYFKFKVKEQSPKKQFDLKGMIFLGTSIAASVLAFMQGTEWGWTSIAIISLFIISLISIIIFLYIERKVIHPLFDFQIFRNKIYLGCCIIWFCLQMAIIISVFRAIWFQDVLNYSPIIAGLLVLPSTLPILVLAPISGRLLDKYGLKVPLLIGLSATTLGMFLSAITATSQNYFYYLPGLMLIGLGTPLVTTPTSTAALQVIEDEHRGVASGAINTIRQLGGTLGLAISSAIISSIYLTHLTKYLITENISGLSTVQLQGLLATKGSILGNILTTNPQKSALIMQDAKDAYTSAFVITSFTSALFLLIALIATWYLIIRKK